MKSQTTTIWFDRPAMAWTEALPVGNGCLGAMHFGGVEEEHLQLNEGTLWAGGPHNYDHPGAAAALPEIQRLIFAGKYQEAQEIADRDCMSQPLGQAPYQTLGDLTIRFDHSTAIGYRRELDLDSATSAVHYSHQGVNFTREVIASHPDQVIAVHLTADRPGHLNLEVKLTTPQKAQTVAQGTTLQMEGICSDFDRIPGAVRFVALADVRTSGGKVEANADSIKVSNADSVTILISMATSYKSYQDVSGDPMALAQHRLDAVGHQSFSHIKRRHVADHQALFQRVSFNLGNEPVTLPTDQRIAAFAAGTDKTLPALYFQFGRYLMIAGSRPGGQPLTLQGIWNDSLTPPWGSKYTININTEMNYWPVEKAALSECHEPLFDMIAQIAETGKHTARVHYGAKGWVTHHNTDGWRGTAPIDGASWGLWPMGGAWLSTHLWEHYEFGGDLNKLRKHYPIMKGAAEFYLDTLVMHPTKGWLVTNPSTSPENAHPHGSGLSAGSTMDMQIIRDLFNHTVSAAQALGVDEEFRKQINETLAKLAPMQVGHAGQLQEWLDDWDMDAPEMHHRHCSHIYGLFPSSQITPESTPHLADAARRSLEIRGDEGTGWSLAWKINFWARLHDGNHSFHLVQDALRLEGHGGGGVYPNLFDAHPPFQIDGNFGFTSGVVEMLLQSHDGTLHLLPALPDAWPDGEVKGLRARGGVKVDLAWAKGMLTYVRLQPDRDFKTAIRYRGHRLETFLVSGKSVVLNGVLGPS